MDPRKCSANPQIVRICRTFFWVMIPLLRGNSKLLPSDCRQSRVLSLRTSDRRHWCGNPYSPKTACSLTFLPENGFPRQCAHWLGMTCFELCLHIAGAASCSPTLYQGLHALFPFFATRPRLMQSPTRLRRYKTLL